MTFMEKFDGLMLLGIYATPFILALGIIVSMALFLLGKMTILAGWWFAFFLAAYTNYGNFAPFYEIGSALQVDGIRKNVRVMPMMGMMFYFYLWNISLGFLDAVLDRMTQRKVSWDKTLRFNNSEEKR